MMEKWDLYTKYRERTGLEHTRGEEIPSGYYHLAVHVWIKNSRGEYVIARRAADRPTYPLKWECPGGSVLFGESSVEGAIREVKEEVGIDLSADKGTLVFSKIRNSFDGKTFNDLMDVWLFSYYGELTFDAATTDESSDCNWMTEEEIKSLYDAGEFVETLDYFFCAFETEEKDYSSIIGKTVSGTIDRPSGSRHPKHPDMVYPLNYGYIPGITAGDGDEQDVYVFGTDGPITEFTGKVIAVYHRFNDVEDKWIVSLDGEDVSDERILGDISFQEQFFYGKLFR